MSDTMAFTTTYDTGGMTMPMPGVYANPERTLTTADADGFLGGDLNPPFVADFLSAALMHEQCGRHLYRSVAGRTNNPMLGRRYRHFGEETEDHVRILRALITDLGGDPGYVSPSARATEKLDHGALEGTFMLGGSLDLMTQELAMLDAVVLAETVDRANWMAIEQIGTAMADGPMKDAMRDACQEVRPQEDEHLEWAKATRAKLVHVQATRPMLTGLTTGAASVMDWFKGLFADDPSEA